MIVLICCLIFTSFGQNEIIATCETNIACLQNVLQHVNEDFTDEEIDNMKGSLLCFVKTLVINFIANTSILAFHQELKNSLLIPYNYMTEKYCFMLTGIVYLYRYPDTVGEAACLRQGTAVRVQRVNALKTVISMLNIVSVKCNMTGIYWKLGSSIRKQ